MARYNRRHPAELTYKAADQWRERALLANHSIFLEGKSLWTQHLLDELQERFVQNLDTGEENFLEKLKLQLADGSPDCKKLMAELLWILLLFPVQTNIGPARKRTIIREIWSWSGDELDSGHTLLDEDILKGIGSAGTAFNTHRWRELAFLIIALVDFKSRKTHDRKAIASDAWAFSAWISELPGARRRQIIHILPHLLFPESFENSSTEADKRLILAGYDVATDEEMRKWGKNEIDRSLLELRKRLEQEHGANFDFYEDEFAAVWKVEPIQSLLDTALRKIQSKDWKGALADCNEAMRLDVENALSFGLRGHIYNNIGQAEEAIEDCEEAIRLEPEYVDAHRYLGDAKVNLGLYNEAINHCNEAINLDPKNIEALITRGTARNYLDQYTDAINDFDMAKEIDSSNPKSFTGLALAKLKLGNFVEALNDCELAIALDAENATAYHLSSLSKLNLNDLDGAEKDLEKAQELDPYNEVFAQAWTAITVGRQKLNQEQIIQSMKDEAKFFKGNTQDLLYERMKRGRAILWLNFLVTVVWFAMVSSISIYFYCVLFPMFGVECFKYGCEYNGTDNKLQDFRIGHIVYITPLLIILFPFIWLIRILLAARHKNEILKEDYYRRAMIATTIRSVFPQLPQVDQNNSTKQQEMVAWMNYILAWMYHSPAEMLVALNRGKAVEFPEIPSVEQILKMMREANDR